MKTYMIFPNEDTNLAIESNSLARAKAYGEQLLDQYGPNTKVCIMKNIFEADKTVCWRSPGKKRTISKAKRNGANGKANASSNQPKAKPAVSRKRGPRGRYKTWTVAEINKVRNLRKEGWTYGAIASLLDRSQSSVCNMLHRIENG